ncbi:PhzF family phenazine biosynthesis protein [Wukongibacter sp. M2B1]|uniref:PhzF family phenazine biosynthesis protein n=1 Tax=Wukongibacter sp. M2B1 TaxID=3088895 RepID=UPI003D7BE186
MKIYQIDTFTDVAFKGNAAAVCILEKDYDDLTLKNIAMEMNLSETAFLKQVSDNVFNLRWFTPEVEVSLCGHGTLASAHLLWENGIVKEDEMIYFKTLSGTLAAKKKEEWIELDMPKGNLIESEGDDILFESLKINPKSIYEDEIVYLLEFNSEEEITKLSPDFNLLKKARKEEIIVTSICENEGYDFVSRFFGPAIGVDEDPVTGSAHCYLAPYWIERLEKDEVLGFQASRRTGCVKCKLNEDRVLIQGKAKTILKGVLEIQ